MIVLSYNGHEETDMNKLKILVCGDSHGDNEILNRLLARYPQCDYYIFCGDSNLDIDDPLMQKFYSVKGNHDFADFPANLIIATAYGKILVTHGHLWDVYYSYASLKEYMQENNIQICFHGHTHIPSYIEEDGFIFINPGSLMINRASYGFGTYALVDWGGRIDARFYHYQTDKDVTSLVLKEGLKTLKEIKSLLWRD